MVPGKQKSVFFAFLLLMAVCTHCLFARPSEIAVEVDGSDDVIAIDDEDDLYRLTSYTYSFWIKVLEGPTGAWRQVFTKGQADPQEEERGPSVWLRDDSMRFHFTHSTGRERKGPDSTEIPVNQWLHVAFVTTGPDGDMKIFLNGEKDVSASVSGLTADLQDSILWLGNGPNHSGVRSRFSDFRVYDRALADDEIEDLHAGGNVEKGLVGYWPLSEGHGNAPEDLARGNDAKLEGDPRWSLARPFKTDLEPEVLDASRLDEITLGPVELRDPQGEVSYQWYVDGDPIEGATQSSITISDISRQDAGSYFLRVDDERDLTPVDSARVGLAMPDWPMWRFDPERSAATPIELEEELHLQWVRELPSPRRAWPHQWDDRGKLDFDVSYSPVVKGDKIFVPSNTTDSVTAYSISDGEQQWRFYADGPVRLAPVAWDGRVYFVSDDGYLYCVDSSQGDLLWKFRGGPSDHRLLGNERIINFWAARGGPVVSGGHVYFTAGIWPHHGVFIYSLDARSGELRWVNDSVSSDYVALPHGGAYGYGGLAPQGYLAVDGDELVVSPGRGTSPARLDRRSGEVLVQDFRGGKGRGGYAVHSGGLGKQRNQMLESRVDSVSDQIDGEVFYKLGARARLFVTTECGSVYCFGPDPAEPRRYSYEPSSLDREGGEWSEVAADLLAGLGESEGYALVLGAGSGELVRELLHSSDMHVVVVEEDTSVVRELRDELSGAGFYGRRVSVLESSVRDFSVQPYLFSLVLSEDAVSAGLLGEGVEAGSVLDYLRPYGGRAWLGASGDELDRLLDLGEASEVDQVSLEGRGDHLYARRSGPLSGAGEWTHQYHDSSNSLVSRDELVRLPLGLLWFGGPNNHNILPRHSGGPRPKVAGGRQVFLGVETIGARCVYTGRELWEREYAGIGHPFTNLELEERWSEGEQVYMTNIPGSAYIGSPFVALGDSIYLRYEGEIHRLDPSSGAVLDTYSLPGRSVEEIYGDAEAPEWGHISVQGDHLIATSEPHIFEDQELGWTGSYSGTSSRRLSVLDRHDGEVLWDIESEIGFRHNAIVSAEGTVFLIDGLSENALDYLKRRGESPEAASRVFALDIESGEELWSDESDVYGTFLLYSAEHDVLVEGGSQDLRHRLGDEPAGRRTARCGSDGEELWESGGFTLPGAVVGDKLIPGRPGTARSILSGERLVREDPLTGRSRSWSYERAYGCNTLNASEHLLLFRTGYAGYYDLEHGSGTGNFSGFRSGCTANMIAADGVLNALDYTRTCTCNYAHQTSLAMIHMPEDTNIEFWTRYEGAMRDPSGHGLNFGAPGRRVDVSGGGFVWYDEQGGVRRHPSSLHEGGGSIEWVASSLREGEGRIEVEDLLDSAYEVRLHFAELDADVSGGERVFDVLVDGEELLSGYDVAGEAGGALRGVVEELRVEVEGGGFELELRRAEGSRFDPVISGIELLIVD